MFVADGLAFCRELSAVLLAIGKNDDEATGAAEKAINRPIGNDVAFANLTGPREAEYAGG